MPDDITKMIQDEIEENNKKLEPVNNAKKTAEKNTENLEKNAENAENSTESEENNNISIAEENAENLEENSTDEEQEYEDDFEDDFDGESDSDFEDIEIEELDEDPDFKEIREEEEAKAEQPQMANFDTIKKKVGGSPKNTENLEKLGLLLLSRADIVKAKLCSAISGKHIAEYLADEELKAALIAAIKEYLANQEFKEPSPFGTLMIALCMWSLPPLGLAFWDKYGVGTKKEKIAPIPTTAQQEVQGEHKGDYSHLKEYQDQRKIFSLTKDGFYNRTPSGTFIKVAFADEKPSPQVQAWIDEEKSNKEIRTLLNYGK